MAEQTPIVEMKDIQKTSGLYVLYGVSSPIQMKFWDW